MSKNTKKNLLIYLFIFPIQKCPSMNTCVEPRIMFGFFLLLSLFSTPAKSNDILDLVFINETKCTEIIREADSSGNHDHRLSSTEYAEFIALFSDGHVNTTFYDLNLSFVALFNKFAGKENLISFEQRPNEDENIVFMLKICERAKMYIDDITEKFPSASPSTAPTASPTFEPSPLPTRVPSSKPTELPSASPTAAPTPAPSSRPTLATTREPSSLPTLLPTNIPSLALSREPSLLPSHIPTIDPSVTPSLFPTSTPSVDPSSTPSLFPTLSPSTNPSGTPTFYPTSKPSIKPSQIPTTVPSFSPSRVPSFLPSISSVPSRFGKLELIFSYRVQTEGFDADEVRNAVNNTVAEKLIDVLTLALQRILNGEPVCSRRKLQRMHRAMQSYYPDFPVYHRNIVNDSGTDCGSVEDDTECLIIRSVLTVFLDPGDDAKDSKARIYDGIKDVKCLINSV